MTKVSVIITCHNYGRYLAQAIESVLQQTFRDFEIIVVDDGSTDNTPDVIKVFAHHPMVRTLRLDGIGLARSANAAIRASSGEYIIRLDADDYFDENILLVLANILDRHAEYGMVFPDYYQVTQYGEVIDQIRQPKVNDEVKLLDRSALAAGALYRRSCYEVIGGYSEELRFNEDYDFWIRFVDRFRVYNVQLPLMYYRKHNNSMSTTAAERRAIARRHVKAKFVERERDLQDRKVLFVLPIMAENRYRRRLALTELHGRPMLAYAIEQAKRVKLFDRVIVDTEDEAIAEAARAAGAEVPFIRPRKLARLTVSTTEVLRHCVRTLDQEEGYRPDLMVVGTFSCPFITAAHMEEALHSLAIFHCDSVIGVGVNLRYHWQPGPHGLEPVLYPRKLVNDQKWVTYEERGGLYALTLDNLHGEHFLGKSVSFVEIDEAEGLRIDSDYHFWLAEQMLKVGFWERRNEEYERFVTTRAAVNP
ncbi:MAG: glycosyltransferase [Magnetospirillum sp. WYHS-4]